MAMIYFEDGTKEMILDPFYDFRRVIEERLGKDSAELFEEIVDDADSHGFTEAEKFLETLMFDISRLISNMKDDGDCNYSHISDLEEIRDKIDEFDVWDYKE